MSTRHISTFFESTFFEISRKQEKPKPMTAALIPTVIFICIMVYAFCFIACCWKDDCNEKLDAKQPSRLRRISKSPSLYGLHTDENRISTINETNHGSPYLSIPRQSYDV